MCVQPFCDSVRLDDNVRMPFLPFEVVTTKPFDLVVERGASNALLRLRLEVSPSALEHVEFLPDPLERAVLVRESGPNREFVDTQGRSWVLVSRLKPAHAQRVAQRVGTEFSRIGLNESEWLRLQAKG